MMGTCNYSSAQIHRMQDSNGEPYGKLWCLVDNSASASAQVQQMYRTNPRYSKGNCAKERDQRKTGLTTQFLCKLRTAQKIAHYFLQNCLFRGNVPCKTPSSTSPTRVRKHLLNTGCVLRDQAGRVCKPLELPRDLFSLFELARLLFAISPTGSCHLQMNLQLHFLPRLLLLKYIFYLFSSQHAPPPGISSKSQYSNWPW